MAEARIARQLPVFILHMFSLVLCPLFIFCSDFSTNNFLKSFLASHVLLYIVEISRGTPLTIFGLENSFIKHSNFSLQISILYEVLRYDITELKFSAASYQGEPSSQFLIPFSLITSEASLE